MIVTTRKLKKLGEVEVGDKVVTHKGTVKPVIGIYKRKYRGKLVKLRLSLLRIPLLLTPDQPLYAINTKSCSLGFNRPCTPTCSHVGETRVVTQHRRDGKIKYEYRRRCREYYREYKPEWVEAGEIVPKKSFLVITMPSSDLRIPDWVPLEPDLWYIFGLYIAEGTAYVKHGYKNRRDRERGIKRPTYMVYFTLGRREENLIKKLVESLKRMGFNPSVRVHTESTARITVYSKRLYELIMSLFNKYSSKKRIPLWVINLPPDLKEIFLKGIRDGDGDRVSHVTTINPNIAFMTWLLVLSVGKPSSLRRVDLPSKTIIEGRLVNQSPHIFKVHDIKRSDFGKVGRYWFQSNQIILEVLEKEYVEYEGYAYNLMVEDMNSYSLWGVLIRGCPIDYS